MKISVFGATGSVGRLVVQELLAQGHQVRAFARRIDQLDVEHPALEKRAGNVMDTNAVDETVAGCDAVVITLGAGASPLSRVRSAGTRNIVRAMEQHGVQRLICQSTLGAGDSWGNLDFFWRHVMFGFLLRPAFRDHERQEQRVLGSDLAWTIVRPSAFSDTPVPGSLKVDFSPRERNLSLKIGRSEIAQFLVRCISGGEFVGRAVAISH